MTGAAIKIFIIIAIGTTVILGLELIHVIPVKELKETAQKDQTLVRIKDTTIVVEVANDEKSRKRGLSERDSLAAESGMLFMFEAPNIAYIWMKEMRFPIDIFWIAGGKIVHLEENVAPPKPGTPDSFLPIYGTGTPIEYVLETNAGFARKYGINSGDGATIGLRGAPAQHVPETGEEYFIEALRKKKFEGGAFTIGDVIEENRAYKKYTISYNSAGLRISGIMNIPKTTEGMKMPLIVLNHGLIPREIYFSGRGSKREQDFFARHGYVVIHPDYRGLASSSPNPSNHHDFYQGYTEDVINLIEALRQAQPEFIDLERIGMWGHSMGGGIVTRVMALRQDVKAYVLFAPISADAKDNFYELSEKELLWLKETYGEGEGADRTYKKISPINYFDLVSAPVQLHHGAEDGDVPMLFSQKIYDGLKDKGKTAEVFFYPEEKHEFIDAWPLAIERALKFFDAHLK